MNAPSKRHAYAVTVRIVVEADGPSDAGDMVGEMLDLEYGDMVNYDIVSAELIGAGDET